MWSYTALLQKSIVQIQPAGCCKHDTKHSLLWTTPCCFRMNTDDTGLCYQRDAYVIGDIAHFSRGSSCINYFAFVLLGQAPPFNLTAHSSTIRENASLYGIIYGSRSSICHLRSCMVEAGHPSCHSHLCLHQIYLAQCTV